MFIPITIMNFTRLSVSESVTLGSARGWLAGDTDGLAGRRWAWFKWAGTRAAWRLVLHGWHGQRAAAVGKITVVSTTGFNWGRCSIR